MFPRDPKSSLEFHSLETHAEVWSSYQSFLFTVSNFPDRFTLWQWRENYWGTGDFLDRKKGWNYSVEGEPFCKIGLARTIGITWGSYKPASGEKWAPESGKWGTWRRQWQMSSAFPLASVWFQYCCSLHFKFLISIKCHTNAFLFLVSYHEVKSSPMRKWDSHGLSRWLREIWEQKWFLQKKIVFFFFK